MKLEHRLLMESEVADGLAGLKGWAVEDGKLAKRFLFKTYKDGLVFSLAVGHAAEQLDHHPDIELGYAKVRISVNSHDVNGLSPYDFELAKRIDALQG